MIIFDYLIISREECINTNTYKIKYNDAIHFAYQKILSKINIIDKDRGSIINNLKSMNTNKSLYLTIYGINLIKSIFNCLFKLQFTADTNAFLKNIDIIYYQKTISELKSNAILHATAETIICKKIDKLHKQVSSILFYNVDIIEHFIINLIPDILSCIKSSDFDITIYSIYIGYLTEYNCKLKEKTQYLTTQSTISLNHFYDLNIFIIIILLFQHHHNNIAIPQLPYSVLIDKYYSILQNINFQQDCEKIFKVCINQLTVDHLFNTGLAQLLNTKE
jgi:hypothetical protein